jgi:hypothetical protein
LMFVVLVGTNILFPPVVPDEVVATDSIAVPDGAGNAGAGSTGGTGTTPTLPPRGPATSGAAVSAVPRDPGAEVPAAFVERHVLVRSRTASRC